MLHYALQFPGAFGTALTLTISVAALLLVACLLWPGWGLLARRRGARLLRRRIRTEDALKHIFKSQNEQRPATLESLAGAVGVNLNSAAEIVNALQKADFATLGPQGLHLTPSGERYALNVVRAHRLWEQHLAEQTGIAESRWHELAEAQEHFITPQQADSLSARLGHPPFDPHGDPIPNREGEFPVGEARALSTVEPGCWVRVVHVEDEPEQVCAQIRAVGLYPGTVARVVDREPHRLTLWCDGLEHVLAPVVAANLSVKVLPQAFKPTAPAATLSDVRIGGKARVVRLGNRCRGAERRRLMDLGILPGTVLTSELSSPAGQLNAYRVRDTLVALRKEQADQIQVALLTNSAQQGQ